MPIIDWKEVIPETLREIYVNQRGEEPEGNLVPTDEHVHALLGHFKGRPTEDIMDFLRVSMFAHMAKTQKTRTPFFMKNLLAPARLEFIKRCGEALRDHYTQNVEPMHFSNMVYGAVYGSEMDYLDVMGGLWMKGRSTFLWDLLSPNPYWLIFSEYYHRFDKGTVDTWDAVTVEYGGKYVGVLQARARERKKLGDNSRWVSAHESARKALRDAAVDWASRLGFMRVTTGADNETLILHDSEMPVDLITISDPLLARDKRLFRWARECVERRALDTDAVGHATAVRVLEPVEPHPPNILHKLNPHLAAKHHDAYADR